MKQLSLTPPGLELIGYLLVTDGKTHLFSVYVSLSAFYTNILQCICTT